MKPLSGRSPQHLDDARLQQLADGSLRGPEGTAAREHTDSCTECGEGLRIYRSLVGQLDALVDPAPPADFTMQVLEAVSIHEEQLAARRHIHLAAIPALLVGTLAVIGWAFSAGPGQRLDEFLSNFTLCRQVCEAALPALDLVRIPLAIGAFTACLAIGIVLVRAVRMPRSVRDGEMAQ
jgi:hypothetical protein